MLFVNRFREPLSITFAFVATHNHFVLDRGGKVFNRSAPVIKLPPGSTEDDHLVLLGLLNSSTACFWMKQIFHNKGAGGGTRVASGHSPLAMKIGKATMNTRQRVSFLSPSSSRIPPISRKRSTAWAGA